MTSGIDPGPPYVEPTVELVDGEPDVVLPDTRPVSKGDVAAAVGDRLADNLPPELIKKLEDAGITAEDRTVMAQAVFDGQVAVVAGDDLGTIRLNPDNGFFYIRVNCEGVHKWLVVDVDNGLSTTFDVQPYLVFPVIYPTPDVD